MILELLGKLCSLESVTGVKDAENKVPEFLMRELSSWEYFRKYPENLWHRPLKDDRLERVNFVALVRAEPAVKDTILFISHHDVVDVDVFGRLKPLAFNPFAYTEALKQEPLNKEAKEDLESGRWLFGRGVSDMKGGMAVQLSLLKEYASFPHKLKANIMLMTLADEEDDGYGVHEACRMLKEFEDEGFEFIACIDSEPTITNATKDEGRIYTGSIGNASLFALAVGKESHVGEYFQGINAALIAAHLVEGIEGAPVTADNWMDVSYSPATCLKIRDLRELYSVTLLDKTALVFNFLMVRKNPYALLSIIKNGAEKALTKALEGVRNNTEAAGLCPVNYASLAISFGELTAQVANEKRMSTAALMKELYQNMPSGLDTQERGLEAARRLIDISGLRGPLVLYGFLSPYCQPRLNERQTEAEMKALAAVEEVIRYAEEAFSLSIIHDEVYEGISDMSEMGYQGTDEDLIFLTENMAGWKADFHHPFDVMKALDIPVINLGPIGKDAHKQTERVDTFFLTRVLPELLKKLVDGLSDDRTI